MIPFQKLLNVLREEAQLDLHKLSGRLISSAIPQFAFNRVRTILLREIGFRIGKTSSVMGELNITGVGNVKDLLSIGEDVRISGPLHIDLAAPVEIGDRVSIGHHVMIMTVGHQIGTEERRGGNLTAAPVSIGNGVWIGSGAHILPDVKIGNGAVVACGAVVVKDVAANSMVGGVPARILRFLNEECDGR